MKTVPIHFSNLDIKDRDFPTKCVAFMTEIRVEMADTVRRTRETIEETRAVIKEVNATLRRRL